MPNLRPLHRQAAQYFDERFIGKQNESFPFSQNKPFGSLGTEL